MGVSIAYRGRMMDKQRLRGVKKSAQRLANYAEKLDQLSENHPNKVPTYLKLLRDERDLFGVSLDTLVEKHER